jgi:hypothetical protein
MKCLLNRKQPEIFIKEIGITKLVIVPLSIYFFICGGLNHKIFDCPHRQAALVT